ncbi:flagellar biosynthesis protein FlgJ [Sphingomonas soli]|uniref:flagellar biosynthesis protein FlgJ n=1 Tax=Sphingomonas soli TaxID=266127 RepID=UPI0008369FC5|nr:flagellar biosynthesis protein FlgJ [Sphingomonas soli]
MSVTSVNSTASVKGAIAAASRKTGIDFNYLIGQAQVESGMRPDARAGTSSATGLYQFIEQSWLGVVKDHGGKHGMGWAAGSIRQTANGRYVVSDPAARAAILGLRNDPNTAAIMAAEHASDNKAALEQRLGRPATGTDLYMAHFLGLGGATKFLDTMASNPERSGAGMFPAAARANHNIFYGANGQPRTLSEIYSRFAGKLDSGAAAGGATGGASGSFELAQDPLGDFGENEVILGNGAAGNDRHWVETTIAQLNVGKEASGDPFAARRNAFTRAVDPLRPTPETAKLAYLMLANLGA